MVVLDTNATSKGLFAAKLNSLNCAWSTLRTLDGLTGGAAGGSSVAGAFTKSGKIGVVMYDINTTRLKYYSSADGDTWTSGVNISTAGAGMGASLAFDGTNERPRAAYFDLTNSRVLTSSCSTAFASCSGNNWTESTVDAGAGVTGLAAGAQQLLKTEIIYDEADRLHVVYPRGGLLDGNLIVRSLVSNSWVETTKAAGVNANHPGIPVLNFGQAGWNVSGILNGVGSLSTFHVGPGNALYQTQCGY